MAQQTDHIPDVRKKLTAVEWLVEKLMKGQFINSPDELIQQAKEMEKDQIMNSWVHGICDIKIRHKTAEQYYNEQYGK